MELKVVEYYPGSGESCLVDCDGMFSFSRPTWITEEIAERVNMHEELVTALQELSIAVDEFTSASFLASEVEAAEDRLDNALSDANALLAKLNGEDNGSD